MTALNNHIGTFEVKTHLSKILRQVKNGQDFIITVRGEPVAKLSPIEQKPKMTYHEAVKELIEMRKLYQGESGSFNLKEAREWGRK